MTDLVKSWRHLFSAILALSTDEGVIERRLHAAYSKSLRKILPTSDLPAHLRTEFEQLIRDLEDLYAAPAQDSKRAASLARKVVTLYDRITKEL
jgi:hypothetical protein